MNPKTLYLFAVLGLVTASFSGGWIAMLQILDVEFGFLHGIGAALGVIGMIVVIYALSTMRKIELEIE